MTNVAASYLDLERKLNWGRLFRDLDEGSEDRLLEAMDELWWKMTAAEQADGNLRAESLARYMVRFERPPVPAPATAVQSTVETWDGGARRSVSPRLATAGSVALTWTSASQPARTRVEATRTESTASPFSPPLAHG